MDLEYYTIDQAARRLSCEADEIEHLLETAKLQAHLYSNARNYLIVAKGPESWVGRGVATYSGLVRIHKSYIQPLLHNKKVTIRNRIVLERPADIILWKETHPFDSDASLLTLGINAWIPITTNEARGSDQLVAIPLPLESQGGMRAIATLVKTISKNPSLSLKDEYAKDPKLFPEFSYSYYKNGEFDDKSLRISHDRLNQLLNCAQPEEAVNIRPVPDPELPWCDSKEKTSRLDRAIERLYIAHATKQARALWLILMADYDLDTPEFDTQHVIRAMDEDSIEWLTTEGYGSEIKFKSFTNKISTIRKFYKSTS